MYVTIINDCKDNNAMNRQATRAAAFFGAPVSKLGVTDFGEQGSGEIEAAGNIIETIDAAQDNPGIILANVAIRHGKGKRFPNGTPFGYFTYKDTFVFASIDGFTLSLVKKFGLTKTINVFDIPTVMDAMIAQGVFPKQQRELVVDSQFRSFEFLPRVAQWITKGLEVPSTPQSIDEVVDMPNCIWWVDNFGNCITSLLPADVDFAPGKKVSTKLGEFTCYQKLKDVPNGEEGLIIGSSGLGLQRFLWLVIQGGNFAKKHSVVTGTEIL